MVGSNPTSPQETTRGAIPPRPVPTPVYGARSLPEGATGVRHRNPPKVASTPRLLRNRTRSTSSSRVSSSSLTGNYRELREVQKDGRMSGPTSDERTLVRSGGRRPRSSHLTGSRPPVGGWRSWYVWREDDGLTVGDRRKEEPSLRGTKTVFDKSFLRVTVLFGSRSPKRLPRPLA